MSRFNRAFWVATILMGGYLAALPFRKGGEQVSIPPSPRGENDLELGSRDIPLQVPSTGVSPAAGLYIEDTDAWESPREPQLAPGLMTAPSIRRESPGPPSMPAQYDSPLPTTGSQPDFADQPGLTPIPPGSFEQP